MSREGEQNWTGQCRTRSTRRREPVLTSQGNMHLITTSSQILVGDETDPRPKPGIFRLSLLTLRP